MDIKKLLIRTVSGIIYVAAIVGCILWGEIGVTILGCLLALIAGFEFIKICNADELSHPTPSALDLMGVILLAFSFNPWIPVIPLIIWLIFMLARLIAQIYVKEGDSISMLSHSMMLQAYIGIPLATMGALTLFTQPEMILLVFLMLWINDTGAYIVGSLLGRHKLFERISPKKSWEGFIGGLLFNIIAALIFCYTDLFYFGLDTGIVQWIIVAVIITVFGTWGDLLESMIKRRLHIKDSGNIIPGHGGILDRIDSFLLAMPAFFIYILAYEFFKGYNLFPL
ncbi:MAG: phosphatidate cytidylyltransferase [Muribaculaceae bacterium]|nr:phosphatidate cytidylyltransferase [Muribaculaceae bacterium]